MLHQAADEDTIRSNEALGLQLQGYDPQALGYANGGAVGSDYSSLSDDDLKAAYSAAKSTTSPLDRALQAENVQGPVADIARSIYQQESSSGKNTRTSNAGAVGGMQVMPTTFKDVADPGWDINDPEHNARAGVRYVKAMYEQAGGDPKLTAAGYYGGPGGLEKARQGIAVSDPRNPNAPNTLQYGDQVAGRLPATSAQAAPTNKAAPTSPYADMSDEQLKAAYEQARSAPANQTFLQNVGDGLVKGATDLKAGIQQRIRGGLETIGAKGAADEMGLATPEFVAKKRAADAPVMETAGGKVGDFAVKMIPGAIAMLTPAGRGLAGSTVIGAVQGAIEPTTADESATKNAVAGGIGGAAGYGVAKGIGTLAENALNSASKAAILNGPKDRIAAIGRDAGYTIPPTQTNPTILNSALEGFAGKLSTAQKASVKNQPVTNRLAAEELGLNSDVPLSGAALDALRTRAGQAYADVANTGTITPTQAYGKALDDIVKPYVQAAKGFPNAPQSPVIAQIDALRSASFDATSAIAKIKTLRADADAAYRAGNKDTGKALKAGANALEDAVDTHLQTIGAPADMLKNFRDARQTIAKTYSVQGALNDSTGNVNAVKLASQLAKGRPLSGNLRTIAETAQAFPTAAKEVTTSTPGISPLDYMGSTIGGIASGLTGGLVPGALTSAAMLVARPTIRTTILSKPFQQTIGTASYGGSATLNALSSKPAQIALRGGVPAVAIGQVANDR